jgi:hypothetical protein
MGPQYVRSRRYAEIDITYRCNLRCSNCNRSCTQAPSNEIIPVEAVEAFVEQSISRGMQWERIRLLGGEPTLHPELPAILNVLLSHKSAHLPEMRIVLCTNGAGDRVNRVLSNLPMGVEVKSTAKSGRQRLFRPFNLAPVDGRLHRFYDFRAGCRIISDCGLGLTPTGYYPCAVAGGIDRVFGFGLGRSHLPDPEDDMRDQLSVFCRYCGHFGFRWPTRRQKTSTSWKMSYGAYRKQMGSTVRKRR